MANDLKEKLTAFLTQVTSAMGLHLQVKFEDHPDHTRVDLEGPGGEVLLRRKGEALDALQHIVNTAFRRGPDGDHHFVVDCLGYRKNKELELRQMTQYLIDRAKTTREPQEIGPLNPFHRRLVHLQVAEDPHVSSESVGDAFLKTVIISVKK
ncbi:MAG TPA: R3H domain-containing nucleic acid-binding protein [Vicinamibacterales bacterium]|nr:R3H domain-containing nucleic acid-binding protein [Vicinamibacterales bacterium]